MYVNILLIGLTANILHKSNALTKDILQHLVCGSYGSHVLILQCFLNVQKLKQKLYNL